LQRRALHLLVLGNAIRKIHSLKVSRQRPLVLLVNVDWKHVEALGSEEGSVVGSGLFVTNLNYV
jgi:hypothetical protein